MPLIPCFMFDPKFLIFGNSGSGKSTLARELCEAEGVAHLDLDTLAWEDAMPPVRKSLQESGAGILQFIRSNVGWVIEGCYTDLLEVAAPYATDLIFMNLPIETCIQNAKARPWEPHKYPSKTAQDANLNMLIDWISQYAERTDTFSQQAHQRLFDKFQGNKRMYVSNDRQN